MILAFRTDVAVAGTMCFDEEYEEALQLSVDVKRDLLRHTLAVWLTCDGELAGEIYGLSPKTMWDECGETIEDTDPGDGSSLYVFSTTILGKFQGRGLGTLLKAYYQGLVTARGYRALIGHATSPEMVRINEKFNAVFGVSHPDWYGTKRVARFYSIAL